MARSWQALDRFQTSPEPSPARSVPRLPSGTGSPRQARKAAARLAAAARQPQPNEGKKASEATPENSSDGRNLSGTSTDPPNRPTLTAAQIPSGRDPPPPPPRSAAAEATAAPAEVTVSGGVSGDSTASPVGLLAPLLVAVPVAVAAPPPAMSGSRVCGTRPRCSIHTPSSSLLTMPATPSRRRPAARRLKGRETTGSPTGVGPRVPHRNATRMAVPPQTPCAVDRPTFAQATKESDEAPTKSAPARAPRGTTAGNWPSSPMNGSTAHDDAHTPSER
mmetsp:Transcript_15111/g.50919  ORF Transcript_15111/g.50919 Transcript_15111/m.50919 type:complete len:277 (-) Transcript_15111:188-1018(-)